MTVTVNVIPEQRFTSSVSLPAPNAFGTVLNLSALRRGLS